MTEKDICMYLDDIHSALRDGNVEQARQDVIRLRILLMPLPCPACASPIARERDLKRHLQRHIDRQDDYCYRAASELARRLRGKDQRRTP